MPLDFDGNSLNSDKKLVLEEWAQALLQGCLHL